MNWRTENDARVALIDHARAMNAAGINVGKAGNLSLRWPRSAADGFLITPSALPYDLLEPDDIVWLPLSGGCGLEAAGVDAVEGRRKPSSEWRFHRDIYAARPEVGAVLHAHSPFAVSLACLRYDIPPFHYMIARFGGDTIRCADYAIFGSNELSTVALAAMEQRKGCLLANHGLLVAGRDLEEALALAIELEELCEQYWRACQLGQPVLLNASEMGEVIRQFAGYGQQ